MVSPIVWRTAKERRFYTHVLGIGRAFSLSSVGHFISVARMGVIVNGFFFWRHDSCCF